MAFICQLFYVLIKELGLNENTTCTNKTYIQVNKTNDHVISNHLCINKQKLIILSHINFQKLSHFGQQRIKPVIDTVRKLNVRNKATSDFLYLYTNFSHNKIKNVMTERINFIFKRGGTQFIVVKKICTTYIDDKNKFKITFDKASLKLAIDFLLHNGFFNFGNLSF